MVAIESRRYLRFPSFYGSQKTGLEAARDAGRRLRIFGEISPRSRLFGSKITGGLPARDATRATRPSVQQGLAQALLGRVVLRSSG